MIRGKNLLSVAAAALLAGGCVTADHVRYLPNLAAEGVEPLPLNVAVLELEDKTEPFTSQGSGARMFWGCKNHGTVYNWGKGYVRPIQWSKFLADELSETKSFREVELVMDPTRAPEADIIVSGELLSAKLTTPPCRDGHRTNADFVVRFVAKRKDGALVLDKVYERHGDYSIVGSMEAWQIMLQGMLGEARRDLLAAVR